jgi:hypothetical protein
VDGLAVAGLSRREYVRLEVDPGPRRIWITCFDGITDSDFLQAVMSGNMGRFSTPKPLGDWESDFMVLDVQEGGNYYIEAKPKTWSCAGIKQTEAVDLHDYVEIDSGSVSKKSLNQDIGGALSDTAKMFKNAFTPGSAAKSGDEKTP